MATASEPDRASLAAAGSAGSFAAATELDAPCATVLLSGELDLAGAPTLERKIDALPWQQLSELVFDLAEVTFIDSTGLSVLIRAAQRAAGEQVRCSVVRVPEQALKLFTIAGVMQSLNVDP